MRFTLFASLLLIYFSSSVRAIDFPMNKITNSTTGCPNRVFLQCLLQLKEDNVQLDRNIVRVILNIDSEAKLLHNCKSYIRSIPCFRDRIAECGNEDQKTLFGEAGRAIMFLCSNFSLKNQKILIQHHSCIARTLSTPSSSCTLPAQPYGERLNACKRHCATMPRNFTCSMHTWMFEQQACLQNDITNNCGNDAANFYADLQSNIFETNYPLICDGDRLRTKSSHSHYNLSTTAPPMAKTEPANLFAKVRLSTRNPTIAPAAQRFPPNSTPRRQITTRKSNITTSTTSPVASNVSTNSFRSNMITNSANNLPPHSVLLFSVLRKILTNSALQQHLNLKDLIQNIVKTTTSQTTKTQSLPRIPVTPNSSILSSTQTPIKFITSGPTVLIATRVEPNNSTVPTNNSRSYQPTHKKWRPWYFTESVEDNH